jgi:hypothetical protein
MLTSRSLCARRCCRASLEYNPNNPNKGQPGVAATRAGLAGGSRRPHHPAPSLLRQAWLQGELALVLAQVQKDCAQDSIEHWATGLRVLLSRADPRRSAWAWQTVLP